jgi:hypothetical protein
MSGGGEAASGIALRVVHVDIRAAANERQLSPVWRNVRMRVCARFGNQWLGLAGSVKPHHLPGLGGVLACGIHRATAV